MIDGIEAFAMTDHKKIIVDEDWKAQVQAEKEAAAKSRASDAPKGRGTTDQVNLGDAPMPPASLEMLLTTLATEALVALGEVPHPATGKVQYHPHQSKYLIDTFDMLRQKTKGNLTAAEQQAIDSVLHQLRMIFVEKMNQLQPASTAPGSA
jgi:uncharacterized protein DUF1844